MKQHTTPAAKPVHRQQPPSAMYGVAYSVVDDAKSKTSKLSVEAQQELNKASQASQLKMYSPEFYAASVVGGLLACVSGTFATRTTNRPVAARMLT